MTSIDNSIMVLGSSGMLGSTVLKYLRLRGLNVSTNNHRWPSKSFKEEVIKFKGLIINCIGSIPQTSNGDYAINYDLPIFLINSGKKIVQPCTDCVYNGKLKTGKRYSGIYGFDATDDYGLSKIKCSKYITSHSKNFKIIRCSIIGYDKNNASLMSWLINESENVDVCNGYINHYWNGITTLEWARLLVDVLEKWEEYPDVLVPGINPLNKYELLCIIARTHKLKIKIKPYEKDKNSNKCLNQNINCKDIEEQILNMIHFKKYGRIKK